METREMTCISCPIGCRLSASLDDSGAPSVSGNQCPRGAVYAEAELTAPKRTVTASVRLTRPAANGPDGEILSWAPAMAPCRTNAAFPKERIPELLAALKALRLDLPVRLGQVILADALGTGVDIVATRSLF